MMILVLLIILIVLLSFSIKHLNKKYYVLALCKRVQTVDGSELEEKVCTIPGKTVFGNNFDILSNNPETIFQFCRKCCEYGKGKSYMLHFIKAPVYSVVSAEDAEEVFQSQALISKSVVYELIRPFLGDGLLISTDQKWHFRRKTLTPAFHFNILQTFIEVFKEESEKFIQLLNQNDEQIVKLINVISEFTLNNVCETALGVKLDNIPGSEEYRHTIHQIEDVIVKRTCNPLMYFKCIFYIWGDYKQHTKDLEIAHDFSSRIIERKRNEFKERQQIGTMELENEFGKKKRYAMLDTLLDAESKGLIDHQGICDEVNTFMFEGYDTTSTCLIFALTNLALQQDIQRKCYEEIQALGDVSELTVFDFNKLEYLECVIKETLRLYPSVPFVARSCVVDTKINGLILPKLAQINVHILDIMRDPKHFPDPLKFDPDRFLPQNTTNRHPFAFVPFSAGPRNCIGQKFAILEIKVLLLAIINNFKLLPVTFLEDVTFENGLVLRTKEDIKVKFVKRSL